MLNTSGLTATAGTDYSQATNQTVVVAANATTVPVSIPTTEDAKFEPSETFNATITLGAPVPNFTVRPSTAFAIVTITDDDPEPLLSVADLTVVEGDTAVVTVALANAAHTCTANYTTIDGSATVADGDFTATSGIANLPGVPSTTFSVVTSDDPDIEGSETFTVQLSTPGGDPECARATRSRP